MQLNRWKRSGSMYAATGGSIWYIERCRLADDRKRTRKKRRIAKLKLVGIAVKSGLGSPQAVPHSFLA